MSRSWQQPETLNQVFTELRADYNAAKSTRFRRRPTGVSSMGSGADYHYRNEMDFLRMMELSRALDRDNIIVKQGVDRLVENILQDVGFRLDPTTGDDKLDAALAARWREWSEDPSVCDKAGEQTIDGMAGLGLRHTIVDGDIFFLPLKEGSLQSVEAHRVRTPKGTKRNVIGGILLGDQRQHKEVWITKDDIDPNRSLNRVADVKRYPVLDEDGNRQVFQLYQPSRFSQTRGVTAFAPIVDALGMHDDIQFAMLVKQQVASAFAIIYERDAESVSSGPPAATGAQTTEILSDGSTRINEAIGPGMRLYPEPGVKVHGFSPNIPSAEFFPHAMMILTFIAINLKMPVFMLLLDAKQTNFSGWRGSMDQARIGFRRMQQWLIRSFYRPVYRWKMRQWMETDVELKRLARGRKV